MDEQRNVGAGAVAAPTEFANKSLDDLVQIREGGEFKAWINYLPTQDRLQLVGYVDAVIAHARGDDVGGDTS